MGIWIHHHSIYTAGASSDFEYQLLPGVICPHQLHLKEQSLLVKLLASLLTAAAGYCLSLSTGIQLALYADEANNDE